ncbi:MAG: hypothetical protein NVS3B16_23370 [Vulcanimicrobiaceae bacterium]
MEAPPVANVLPLIDARFAFLGDEFGFTLAQSTEVPSSAWFRRDERTVVVAYDFIREAAVDVDFEDASTGTRHRLYDVLAFETSVDARRCDGLRERTGVTGELDRCATLVETYFRDFLTGDLDAFRYRFREALLVQTTRAAAMREFYEGDARRARALFEAIRSYWTAVDREHFTQLDAGTTLRYLRRRG